MILAHVSRPVLLEYVPDALKVVATRLDLDIYHAGLFVFSWL